MPEPTSLRAAGDQIEQLLDELEATADTATCARAETLLRLVTELYGAGLARAVELARLVDPAVLDAFVDDELLASLLVVHDLHPDSVLDRVEAALARVRPLLGAHGGDVELVGIDPDTATVVVRLLGTCDGCPSSAITLQSAVERAITESAPEIVTIEVDAPAPTPPAVAVTLSPKPTYLDCPAEMAQS
jgi:Fe-S cluster biogenesis protein NfuA